MAKARRRKLVGIGLYSVPLAGRLARLGPSTIRRWLFGYARQYRGETHKYSPLWKGDIPKFKGVGALSFEDLMELRVIAQFLDLGISLHKIKEAAEYAREEFGVGHPFSTRLFGTDGWRIIGQLPHPASNADERGLLDVLAHQWEFEDVIAPTLVALDYPDNNPVAAPFRWWPDGRQSEVVVDPKRSFGHPIVTNAGIRTSVLAGMAEKNSIEEVAEWFSISRQAAEDAKRFEDRIAA